MALASIERAVAKTKGAVMGCDVPLDPKGFDKLMRAIDRELAEEGLHIPQRPIRAVTEVAQRFRLPLPITEPPSGTNHHSAPYWPVSSNVYQWYDDRYGDRLKLDWCLGRLVILIEEEPWTIRLPRFYGSCEFMVSRERQSDKGPATSGPSVLNAIDLVEKLPSARIKTLPDRELAHILDRAVFGLRAFSILNGREPHELLRLANADVEAAVDHLTKDFPEYGLSKWSSLQAAEKLFKAAISLAGGKFKTTHDLSALAKQAVALNLEAEWDALLPSVQCWPGIRYGEPPCGRDEAIRAHHGTLCIAIMLYEVGAKFQPSYAL